MTGAMYDCVGSKHMVQGASYSLGSDRNGWSMDSISLQGGYTVFPNDVYFNGPFTIAAWIYPLSLGSWARVVDIGNGVANNNVLFAITAGNSNQLALHLFDSGSYALVVQATTSVTYGTWQFVTATYDGYTGKYAVISN